MQQQDALIEQVSSALEIAKAAVDADADEDYAFAMRKYKETIRAIESVKDKLPDTARFLLLQKLQSYQQRLETLEGLLPSLSGKGSAPPSRAPPARPPPATVPQPSPASNPTPTSNPSWGRGTPSAYVPTPVSPRNASGNNVASSSIFFVEEHINASAAKVEAPDSPCQRTFWLIRLLHQTMTTGGFLSPKLYVSNAVWDQKGVKFSAVQTKISALQSLLEGLCKLANVDVNNSDDCSKNLDEFCGVANGAQNMLAKHLSFIKESKDEKKGILKTVGTGMARLKTGLSSATDDGYIVILRETLAKTSIFDRWLVRYENGAASKQVWELLSRVCDFFYSVVISFVIRDFNMLLIRYMKKCNESFFED